MPLVVKKNITPDPGNITLFGAKRIVLASYSLTNPIEKLLGALFHMFFTPIDLVERPKLYS